MTSGTAVGAPGQSGHVGVLRRLMALTVGIPDVGANVLRPPEGGDDGTPTWARGMEVPAGNVPEAAPTQGRQPSGGIL